MAFFGLMAFFTHLQPFLFYPYMGVNWLCLATAAFCVLSPWGGVVIDDEQSPGKLYGLFGWWLRIFLMQLSLILVYIGLHTLAYKALPVSNGQVDLTDTLKTIWQHWALYPWGAVAMMTIAMSFTAYNQRRNAFVSSTAQDLLHNKDDSLLTHLLGICSRNALVAALSTTFGLYMLFAACLLVQGHTKAIATGLNTPAFIVALLMLVVAILPFTKSGVSRLMRRQIPSILGIVALILIGAIIVLILSGIAQSIEFGPSKQNNPIFYNDLKQLGPDGIWMLFSANWWLAFTPVCAFLIGRISKGYSVRMIIIGTLIGPAALAAAPHFHYWLNPVLLLVLIWAGFLLFFGLLSLDRNRSMLVQIYLPKLGRFKSRDYHYFFRRVFRFAAASIYLYLPIGIMYLALMMYISGVLNCVVMALASISFIIAIFTKKIAPKKAKPSE